MQQSQKTKLLANLARTYFTSVQSRPQHRQQQRQLQHHTQAAASSWWQSASGATCESPAWPTTSSAAAATASTAALKLPSVGGRPGPAGRSNSFRGATPTIAAVTWPPATTSRSVMAANQSALLLLCCQRSYSKFTAARDPAAVYSGLVPLCEERAHDLVSNLKDSEREAIKLALAKFDAVKQKEGYEGKLAATQWRSRFGRPTKVPALGDVDPSGTFCAFPDDWLKKKAAEKAIEPSNSDLAKIFFVNAVPFLAFGFLDNFTMIIAGDYIEQLFGYFMCISTMAAAGLGNTISDILGIGSAYYVERGCEIMGLKPPDLTPVQMEMKSSRRSANNGRMIGITVGCLIGMFPLLLTDRKPTPEDGADAAPAATGTPEEAAAKKAAPAAAVPV